MILEEAKTDRQAFFIHSFFLEEVSGDCVDKVYSFGEGGIDIQDFGDFNQGRRLWSSVWTQPSRKTETSCPGKINNNCNLKLSKPYLSPGLAWEAHEWLKPPFTLIHFVGILFSGYFNQMRISRKVLPFPNLISYQIVLPLIFILAQNWESFPFIYCLSHFEFLSNCYDSPDPIYLILGKIFFQVWDHCLAFKSLNTHFLKIHPPLQNSIFRSDHRTNTCQNHQQTSTLLLLYLKSINYKQKVMCSHTAIQFNQKITLKTIFIFGCRGKHKISCLQIDLKFTSFAIIDYFFVIHGAYVPTRAHTGKCKILDETLVCSSKP
ncbi:hypothetical protein VP01_722g2 [Puccinia sorghi]|uniref:Uncharacterized protein n=1 Tax=Puccinia sorghi TaxID=27349 RepID=A0A0L6UD78_9BASI|nr:hypothetical protein VP01_722g2 [Puccinia sorghi]